MGSRRQFQAPGGSFEVPGDSFEATGDSFEATGDSFGHQEAVLMQLEAILCTRRQFCGTGETVSRHRWMCESEHVWASVGV